MPEKVFGLTYQGIKDFQQELEERKTVIAAEIAERLKEARALGDVSENSEYDDAKTAQAENEMRILEIESILKNATVIGDEDISQEEVTLGGYVRIRDMETGEDLEYMVVSSQEEDIFNNRISSDSPVGSAILGKKKGSTVTVKAPTGMLKYKIMDIKKPS
ncbi:MAG TPA: transcription elongation factor GreA [Clostridiaceae bacterium]|nr:transcription elongation factor GreA [Clostridiaceae bacterium]